MPNDFKASSLPHFSEMTQRNAMKTNAYYWSFMVAAIITEVIGTLAMKYGASGLPLAGLGVMYFMLILSYTSLAIAVKRIPLAVAYGAWESLGLILIAIFSHILFTEPLSFIKITAIVLIIAGIFLLEHGTEEAPRT